jgi:hypothetical protein
MNKSLSFFSSAAIMSMLCYMFVKSFLSISAEFLILKGHQLLRYKGWSVLQQSVTSIRFQTLRKRYHLFINLSTGYSIPGWYSINCLIKVKLHCAIDGEPAAKRRLIALMEFDFYCFQGLMELLGLQQALSAGRNRSQRKMTDWVLVFQRQLNMQGLERAGSL